MFEKLKTAIKEKLSELTKRTATFDPSVINDPVAQKTDWTPLKGGGANFRTHSLVEKEHYRLEFKPSGGQLIFGIFFIVMGGGIPIFIFLAILMQEGLIGFVPFIPLLMAIPFIGIGIYIIKSAIKPIVFDKRSGYFWKGKIDPISVSDRSEIKEYCELGLIHGLQIIREYVRSDKSSFYSYELNLVLDDCSRLNVVDHGNMKKLRVDAERLAQFLGVPLWDPSGL